jgi:hypothetical protein
MTGGAGEQPDALGLNIHGETFLLESKVSRSDFLSDREKPWRKKGANAIGDSRGYITPKGMLKPDDIPYGWWLLEVHGKTKPVVKVIKGSKRRYVPEHYCSVTDYLNCDSDELGHFRRSDIRQPMTWLIRIMLRAEELGFDFDEIASKKGLKGLQNS